MFGPVLSIGTVNVILKITVMFLVTLAGESAVLCVRLMACFRLKKKGNAPLIYESDGKVFKVRDTIRRLGSIVYFGFFLVLFLSIAILPAEIASDFGVQPSNKCKPMRLLVHQGICGMVIRTYSSFSKELATAFLVEDMKWDREMLAKVPITQGFRKQFDGTEYFGDGVNRNMTLPIAISNCSVHSFRTLKYESTTMMFGPAASMKGEGIGLLGISTRYGLENYSGLGGVFYNFQFHSAFLVAWHKNSMIDSSAATVLEYPHSNHIRDIKKSSAKNRKLTVKAKTSLLVYDVSCEISSMPGSQFQSAVYSYRYAQLARSAKRKAIPLVTLTVGKEKLFVPKPLNSADVTKAAIASKISEPISCEGETFVYTKCGSFNINMAYPLIFITTALFLCAVVLMVRKLRTQNFVKAPISASAWSLFALNLCAKEKKYCEIGSEEYNTNYKHYGKRNFMGEYVHKLGVRGEYFNLRQVLFVHPSASVLLSRRRSMNRKSIESVKDD